MITFDFDYMCELNARLSAPFECPDIHTLQDRVNALSQATAELLNITGKKCLSDLIHYFEEQGQSFGEQYGAITYCQKLEEGHRCLSRGALAENYLRKYLHQYKKDGARILTNVCLSVDNCLTESDAILIMPGTGIIIFEAKYASRPREVRAREYAGLRRQLYNVEYILSNDPQLSGNPGIATATKNLSACLYDHTKQLWSTEDDLRVLQSEEEIISHVKNLNGQFVLTENDVQLMERVLLANMALSKYEVTYNGYSYLRGCKDTAMALAYIDEIRIMEQDKVSGGMEEEYPKTSNSVDLDTTFMEKESTTDESTPIASEECSSEEATADQTGWAEVSKKEKPDGLDSEPVGSRRKVAKTLLWVATAAALTAAVGLRSTSLGHVATMTATKAFRY